MGLFSKKPSTQDYAEAKVFVSKLKKHIDNVADKFKEPLHQSMVEYTLFAVGSYLCSGSLTKGAGKCVDAEIVRAFTKRTYKDEADETGKLSVLKSFIHDIFTKAEKANQNPVYAVYEAYCQNYIMKFSVFVKNPFVQVELRRFINSILNDFMIVSLFEYKFGKEELEMPTPRYYADIAKAPRTVLTKKGTNEPDPFWIVDTIYLNHATYQILRQPDTEKFLMIKLLGKVEEGSKFQLVLDDAEYNMVYDAYEEDMQTFDLFECPLY